VALGLAATEPTKWWVKDLSVRVCPVEGRRSVLLLGQMSLGLAVTEAAKW